MPSSWAALGVSLCRKEKKEEEKIRRRGKKVEEEREMKPVFKANL